MKTLSALIAPIALSALAAPAMAQPGKMQPGLWEHAMTMKSASGQMEAQMAQMQKELASMPPEQRKMVEDMMARQGVTMGGGAGGRNTTIKMCITPEQAQRAEVPQQDGNCKQETVERSGNTVRYRFSCAGNPPTTGEGEYTMASPTSYTGRTTVLTQVQGKPEKMEMTQTGRWLAADCGSIKPRSSAR
jgi:TolA-binding protein